MEVAAAADVAEGAEVAAVDNPEIGIGFRPELAHFIANRTDIRFVEIVAEDFLHIQCIPQILRDLKRRGVAVIPHGVSLSLGGAEAVDKRKVKHLRALAEYFDSPFVSEHIAFVRAGNLDSGHLLPVKRTAAMLEVICENIRHAKEILGSVPLVLENIASTFEWPDAEMSEAEFVSAILENTDCGLLLDLSNLFANSHNLNFDATQYLETLPLARLEYVHMAGGVFKNGLYHDSHCHPLRQQSIKLLSQLKKMCAVPRVMLERDDKFPPNTELEQELGELICA